MSLYRELGVLPKDSRDDNYNVTSEDTSNYKYVCPGDFVVNKMKAWQGSVAVSAYEGVVSPAYYVYRFKDNLFYKQYFHYLLRGCYKDEFMRLSGGIRVGQWDLSSEALENTIVLIPSLEEQKSIAIYLDHKCSEIDTLTSDIETQIETLEQYKRSVITEAVTKGLDPDAEMKDSGVEWIGEIPTIWNISRLKYVCSMQSGDNLTSQVIQEEGNYRVYGGNGVRGYYYKFNTTGENILIGRQGALAGNVHYINEKVWATDHAVVTKAYPNVLTKFLLYVLDAMNLNQYAVDTAAQPGLAVNKIINLAIPFPSLETQRAIVSFLDEKCNNIEDIITVRQTQLSVIEEYKKSLIFEYVTGKKEVPSVNEASG